LFLKILLLLCYFYRFLSFALGKLKGREECGTTNVALVRLEPIDPFVFDRIAKNDAKSSNAEIILA